MLRTSAVAAFVGAFALTAVPLSFAMAQEPPTAPTPSEAGVGGSSSGGSMGGSMSKDKSMSGGSMSKSHSSKHHMKKKHKSM